MMLFLGVLSVFQLTLLPGLLLIRLFPHKRSLIQQLVYVFALSLLANHLAVFLLTFVGLYTRTIVLLLFAVELAAVVWLYRGRLLAVVGGWEGKSRTAVSENLQAFSAWVKKDFWSAGLYFIFAVIAVIGVLWVLWIWVANFNTVFQNWDAWASWDRWAVKWAENRIPGDTWEYPQLIPTSYSLTYKFIGTTAVKFFGKSIMPLFTLAIVLMLVDLGRKFRSFGYMLAAGLALYTINLFLGEYIPDGYVDIPVACFSLMAIYTLLHARTTRNLAELKSTLLLGSLVTAAAAVTKQTGLYVMAFYPVLAYLWILRGRKDVKTGEALGLLARNFVIVLLLVAPWYAFMEYRILYGGNTSNIQYVISDIYKGQTLPERFLAAVHLLGNYAYLYAFLLVSLFVLDSAFRQIVILLVFPFSILWAFFLSYEQRNLAVAMPLLSMSVGVAAEAWVVRIRQALGKRKALRFPVYTALAVGALLLGGATLLFDDEAITARQLSEQRQIFEPTLNQKLYRYFSSHDGPEAIITNYPVGWLPDLENTWRLERFQEYESYQQTLLRYPEVTLILVRFSDVDPRIAQEIQTNIDAGVYQVLFTEVNYMLVRIPAR
ncbi:MAG: hypothetical protein WD751_11980 [Anaerolineales bacterium]